MGYATSRFGDIMGPWDQESEPLYALDGGHAMLFYTFGGQLMMHATAQMITQRNVFFYLKWKKMKWTSCRK